MKKQIALISLLFTLFTLAQTENSLLWKISGNGLQKDSYLFGTMHVSEKIAFHLDDVFYESLIKSDYVALESNPNSWLDFLFESREIYDTWNYNGHQQDYDFYNKPFKITPPKQEEITSFFSNGGLILNGILYRTGGGMQEYQEETYLDMFIYQGGSKFDKKIFSLEDVERSSNLVKKASKNPIKETPDLWLQKKMKDQNYFNLLTNSYRDRNISLIDSLNFGMYKKNYLENMLYVRNDEMANNIDSIVKTGSLFSAIGAAHLAGKKGVINKLRLKGYTVTPLTSKQTSKGQEIKTKIEQKRVKTKFISRTSADGFFTANVPNKLYEINYLNDVVYLCPDIKNGAYVVISRVSTISFLKGKIKELKDIDKFLFEKIPGNIISKKSIVKQGIKGIDIVNKTKIGNYQRHQIFFTPLEILIFKMAGKGTFVKDTGDEFFTSIHFNNLVNTFETISPVHGRFEVKAPKYHTFINPDNIGNRLIQAIDKKNNDYYFVKEVILNDLDYLEEDKFELERIHERFYKNQNLKYKGGVFKQNKNHLGFISKTVFNAKKNKFIHLKTVIGGGHYYLLGYVSTKEKSPNTFFESFKIIDIIFNPKDFEIKKDTSLYFSVKTSVKPKYDNYNSLNLKKSKTYESYTKKATYKSLANEKIIVNLNKYHDYKNYENIDSLWNEELSIVLQKKNTDSYLNNFTNNKLYISDKKQGKDTNDHQYLTYLLRDSLTSRAIKVKNVYVKGALYELKTLIDTKYKTSEFINTFYTSFKPNDTILGKSLFKNKIPLFLKALQNKDSIALNGYYQIKFKKESIKQLKNIISNYKFDDNQLKIKEHLIEELGNFNTNDTKPFLEKLYKNSFENPYTQIAIFKSFAQEKTKESYKNLLKLLEYDIPLTSNSYDTSSMISVLSDSLVASKHLLPELINYTTINEYKEPIYHLIARLLENKIIKGKDYKTYKKQILTEAKIELKRQLSQKINEKAHSNTTYYNSSYYENDILNIYTKLLYPFRKDKNVANFLSKVVLTNNYYVKSTYAILKIKNKESVSKQLLNNLALDLESSSILYNKLYKIDKVDKFPKKYYSKKHLFKSVLVQNNSSTFNKKNDSIRFIKSKKFKVGNKNYDAYFYKSRKKDTINSYDKKWKLNYIAFENIKDKIVITDKYYSEVGNQIDETKTIDEIIAINIEKMILKKRKRVNLKNLDYNYMY